MLKEAADDELIEAVHRARDGDSYLNPRLGAALASMGPSALADGLTERETEVLRLIAAGLSNAAIAEQLMISVGTVKTHLKHIYGKLAVQSRTQAVAQARTLRLL